MTALTWQPVHGIRGAMVAECPLGVFRPHAARNRVLLLLNDVVVGNHGYLARAKRHAARLVEAFMRRQPVPAVASPSRRKIGDSIERQDGLPFDNAAPAPPAS